MLWKITNEQGFSKKYFRAKKLDMSKSFKSFIGNYLREGLLHLKRMTYSKSQKRLMIFPCGSLKEDISSRQRAYILGESLRDRGWRVTIVPFQLGLEQRRRILKLEKPNILLIQKGRHKLNFPELYDVPRIVFDLDDADFLWPDDFVFTNQKTQVIKCCQGSNLVICGSRFVADFCNQYNPNTHVIWTSMASQERDYLLPSQRQRIIAWGTSSAVNFVDEREFLAEVMVKLRQKIDFEFWVYGANDFQALQPFVNGLAKHNVKVKLFPTLSYDEFHKSLENAAVGVQPISNSDPFCLGKSFGKVNSYILRGLPIVVHRKLDYPDFFRDRENGMLASEPEEWVEKIYQLLIEPGLRDKVAAQAKLDFQRELSNKAVAQKVDSLLATLLN